MRKKILVIAAATMAYTMAYAEVPKSIASDQEHLLVQPKFVIGTQNSTAVSYGVLPAKGSSWTRQQCQQFVFVMDFKQPHGPIPETISGRLSTDESKIVQITHSVKDVVRLSTEQTMYQGTLDFPAKINDKTSDVKTLFTYVENTRTLERKGFWSNQYCSGLLAILPGRTQTIGEIKSTS